MVNPLERMPAPPAETCPRCHQPLDDHAKHCRGSACAWWVCGDAVVDPTRNLLMSKIQNVRGES